MRKIIHLDADCFFAAIEMRDNPKLRNIPVAVGGTTSQRGVISTCNYAARRFGVHSAMPTWRARSLCPHLQVVPHNMRKYQEASAAMREIFTTFTDQVEMVSIDEAYLDVSASEHCSGSATLLAREIRGRIARELGITVSAGVAPNKFLAKVASEWRKPDGLYVIAPNQIASFLPTLPVKCIHGVGNTTAQRLYNHGIHSCGDVQQRPLSWLIKQFGGLGLRLFEFSRGIDNRQVTTSRVRKSLGVEQTFAQDLHDREDYKIQLQLLYSQLNTRLGNLPASYTIRKLQAKIKFSNFVQTTLEAAGTAPNFATYLELIETGVQREDLSVRLLGIAVQLDHAECGATSGHQLPLPLPPFMTPGSTYGSALAQ